MNDILNQVFGTISDATSTGAAQTGNVANWLIGAGLTMAQITQILNGVSQQSAASPAMIAYAQQELAYAQQQYYADQQKRTWMLVGGAALLLWVISRD
jgi:hypothetical protein